MLCLEFDPETIQVPDRVIELRGEVSDLAAAGADQVIADPSGCVGKYAQEVGTFWSSLIQDATEQTFGEGFTIDGKDDAVRIAGGFLQKVARVEAESVVELVQRSPVLSRRERLWRRARSVFDKLLVRDIPEDKTERVALNALTRQVKNQPNSKLGQPQVVDVVYETSMALVPFMVEEIAKY